MYENEINENEDNTNKKNSMLSNETKICTLNENVFHKSNGGCFVSGNVHVYKEISISRNENGSFYFNNFYQFEKYAGYSRLNSIKGMLTTNLPEQYIPMENVFQKSGSFIKMIKYLLDLGDRIYNSLEVYPCVKTLLDFVLDTTNTENQVFFLRLVLFTNEEKKYFIAWKYAFIELLRIFYELNATTLDKKNIRNKNQCRGIDYTRKKEVIYINCAASVNNCPHLKNFQEDQKNFNMEQACYHVRTFLINTTDFSHTCKLYSLKNKEVLAFNNIFMRYQKLHAVCCTPDVCITPLWFEEFKKMINYSKQEI